MTLVPKLQRFTANPLLAPNLDEAWQSYAAFNPSVTKAGNTWRMLYRALSAPRRHEGEMMSLSTVGVACGDSPFHFPYTQPFIVPSEPWDRFGCEDPRVSRVGDTWFTFYTALSEYPFRASGIRVAVALSRDLVKVDEKHLVTPFNAKAMALFPEKINGRYVAVLTVDTDQPPGKVALAWFDHKQQIWSESFWNAWYADLPSHVLPLLRSRDDQVEVGAQPVRTGRGWLLVHSYIRHYYSDAREFGIEAVLLDLEDPSRIIGRTPTPIMCPEMPYERVGDVANVVFPSGAWLEGDELRVYYGAADTTGCAATVNVNELLDAMCAPDEVRFVESPQLPGGFRRHDGNPILSPRPELPWEAQSTFNPGVIYEGGAFHLIYRAMSHEGTSVFGYARSRDGAHIDERPNHPVYVPRERFEKRNNAGLSGCEDPRLTRIGDRIYVFYTAYDGNMPRVAFSSIALDDFLAQRWHWDWPQVITPPHIDDKDACIFPELIGNRYAIIHRIDGNIRIDYVASLEFDDGQYLCDNQGIIRPTRQPPGLKKFGIAAPPLRTDAGWLALYHHVSDPGNAYRVGAMLLDLQDPSRVIAETDTDLIEPELAYEKLGDVNNVVFPCGAVLKDGDVWIYYGGADTVIGVARMPLADILARMGL
jgi:predicted GH43/DUF377 family glycosyl hydrolase